ncbi:hypothetical protein G6F31_020845 [Rhizopus arrhizus]|nr:hypothetical protein G6F31_020845 [Rhizopus arrhizus]
MGLLSGTTFHFHATAYGGVQIRFRVQRPEVIQFDDGSAALVSPFPDRLARIQRRKMFRASLAGSANFARPVGRWRGPAGRTGSASAARARHGDGSRAPGLR